MVGTIALAWTLIAVLLALTGADPRALQLVGALWAIYGSIQKFFNLPAAKMPAGYYSDKYVVRSGTERL